ncbi:MAG: hypothetical protein LBD55_07505 [Treponema sp.]|jgi:hypothetical protein|nr:hypothetical protein [Treponema sp.]
MENAGYQSLPEDLKEQAAAMFKGKGGALAYQTPRPDLLTPLQKTLEGNTFGGSDRLVGALRGESGRADTDGDRIFGGDAAASEKERGKLIAREENLIKQYDQEVQDEYSSLIGTYVNGEGGSAAEFQKELTAYNKAVQEVAAAEARGETVEMPVKGARFLELEKGKWHFPVPSEEQSLEITPYQRQAYTGGTKAAPLEVQVVPVLLHAGEPVDNTVKPGLVTPDFAPGPAASEPREAVFHPEYEWGYTGADYSGGQQVHRVSRTGSVHA